ncbi:MAG: hypothetical protein AAB215_05275, partial [Planctomycetota bacterium]
INNGAELVTVQWSIFAGCNLCVRTRGDKVSFHHCLFAENAMRNPLARGDGVRDLRNNVVVGWRVAGIQSVEGESPKLNIINSFWSPPAGAKEVGRVLDIRGSSTIYARGNVGPEGFDWNAKSNTGSPLPEPPVTTQTAEEAKALVLKYAGARPRDEIDRGYADGTRKYVSRTKDEWRSAAPWWTKEKPPPRPKFIPDWTKEAPEEEKE